MESILISPMSFFNLNAISYKPVYKSRLDRLTDLKNRYKDQSKQISIATIEFKKSSLNKLKKKEEALALFYKNEANEYELNFLKVSLDELNYRINYLKDCSHRMGILLNIAKEAKKLTDKEMLANGNKNNQFFISDKEMMDLYRSMENIEASLEKFTEIEENLAANILELQRKIA